MMPAPPTTPRPGPSRARSPWVIIAAFSLVVAWLWAPAISSPDANGYFMQAALWMRTGTTVCALESRLQYIDHQWLLLPGERAVSKYPPGLAVPATALIWCVGPRWATAANPALAVLALIAWWQLCRGWIDGFWRVAALATLAWSPVYLQQALQGFAHAGVCCALLWALVFVRRWEDGGRIRDAFVAGLLLGILPTLRYAEALLLPAIAVYLLLRWRDRPGLWRALFAACAGAAVAVVPLLVHTHQVFGAMWRTGYSLTDEQTGFGVAYAAHNAPRYLLSLVATGIGPLFVVAVLGFPRLARSPQTRPIAMLIAALVAPSFVLYSAYYWPADPTGTGSLRFLHHTLPLWILAGILVLRTWYREGRRGRVFGLIALQLGWVGLAQLATHPHRFIERDQNRALDQLTAALGQRLRPEAILIGRSELLQHLGFAGPWGLVDLERICPDASAHHSLLSERRLDVGDDTSLPGPPGPSPLQLAKWQRTRVPTGQSAAEYHLVVASELAAWAARRHAEVYAVIPEDWLALAPSGPFRADAFEIVARIPWTDIGPPPEPIARTPWSWEEMLERRELVLARWTAPDR